MSRDLKLVNFRLDDEVLQAVDVLAERLRWNRSEVLRRTIVLGVEELSRTADVVTHPVFRAFARVAAELQGDEEREEMLKILEDLRGARRGPRLPGLEVSS